MIKTELFTQHQVNPSEEFFQIYLILKHIWPNNAYCRFEFHSDHYLPLLDNIIISTIFTLKKLYLEQYRPQVMSLCFIPPNGNVQCPISTFLSAFAMPALDMSVISGQIEAEEGHGSGR